MQQRRERNKKHITDNGELERLRYTYLIPQPERDERDPEEQAETGLKRMRSKLNQAR